MATLPQPATAPGGKATGFNDLFKQDQPFLRRSRFLAVAISALLFLFAYTNLWRFYAEIPPDYRAWHERELLLPQNYPDLPYPQGRTGYYVRVSNHVSGLGWGNVMQEMIMNAHMAFKSGRAFSFYNYTWDPSTPHHYTRFGDNWTPARIPISAFVSGPVAGNPFPAPHMTPPAVSSEFFDEVCEYPAQIDVDPYAGDVGVLSAKSLVDCYVGLIRDIPDHCVEFVSHVSKEIFDYTLFEDGPRLLDIWDELIASPILTNWKWSELVMSVMEDNHALVHPSLAPGSPADRPLPGLLALHIRQGDYAEHCQYLLRRRTPFHGFNQHPSFPDQFMPPQGPGTDGAAIDFYSEHCIPEMDYMVERVLSVRAQHANWTGRALDSVYILTNAKREWLDEFKMRLMRRAHWDAIVTSRDLTLTLEQKFVSQASDMMLASRAEVFVGNGWSTLTSNANLLRAAAHRAPETTRFW